MSLRPISILMTASGCPGASTCIRYLKGVQERKITVIGVDADSECIGRFIADAFYTVPLANEDGYVDAIIEVCEKHDIDCVIIPSSYEIEVISAAKPRFDANGVAILASSPDALRCANNKRFLYELFEHDDGVKVPDFTVVNTLDEFVDACDSMGYPKRDLCFKPPFSKGSRGFRYLSPGVSRADLLINHKPDNKIITLNDMVDIFEKEDDFPELLLMETVEGEEIDSMVLAMQGDPLLITHKTREAERGGVITLGGHCSRPELDLSIAKVLKKVPLSYNVGIQFKGGVLMEINPRLSTFMYTRDWIEPYFGVKLALGEFDIEDVRALQGKVPMDVRMIRYFDQCFFDCNGVVS